MKNKVAQITVYFWILKILATTLGETTGDMLSMTMDMGYVTSLAVTGVILLVLLVLQVRAEKFHSARFWLAIIGTTTVGMEISDMMDRTWHLGYFAGSLVLASCLLLSLFIWHLKERTLRVYPINRRNVEVMFWVTVLFSNSLGAAFGDYLTENMGLTYIQVAMVTSGIIGVVLILHYAQKFNDVFLFWVAFIFTRPFGTAFGDLLTKPIDHGGFDLSTINASVVTVVLFAIVLIISHKRHYVD